MDVEPVTPPTLHYATRVEVRNLRYRMEDTKSLTCCWLMVIIVIVISLLVWRIIDTFWV